jgi:hypothetical protein
MRNARNACKILDKKSVEILMRRWENDIKMEFKYVGWENVD